ncbi:hypothetical protein GLA29479_4366 [Lysobacter antibioticus]|nr:hypothetical protein GLA29479_4366 [Lysobacter antibioticus]
MTGTADGTARFSGAASAAASRHAVPPRTDPHLSKERNDVVPRR